MLIYILDPITFDRIAVIEEYESCIWTERFIDPGDFTLTIAEVHPNAALLRGGTLLECEDSEYPMILEGIERADGSLTLTGRTLETYFNEIQFHPRDYWSEYSNNPYSQGAPGAVLRDMVELAMADASGLFMPGFNVSLTTLGFADDGSTVNAKITEAVQAHDYFVSLCRRFNIDMYMKRVEDDDSEFGGPNTYKFAFGSRTPVDRSKTAEDGTDPAATVRFSPQDDNLIDVREVYDATNDSTAVVVNVPEHFAGDTSIGSGVYKVLYGYKPSVGHNDFLDFLSDLEKPPFEIRIVYADSDKLTLDYLKNQIWRYYPGETRTYWSTLSDSQKSDMLRDEMKRLAKAEFNKSRRRRGHVIDGEVVSNTYKYIQDYRLGDKVDVTSGLSPNIPYSVTEKEVTEYIRSVDSSGYRAYPTLAPTTAAEHYADSSHEYDYPNAIYVDHTFSINGEIPDLGPLSPHRVNVKEGETKQLVAARQTGPETGTCDMQFLVNGAVVWQTSWDTADNPFPITLADGDTLTVDASMHSVGATNVSGHFTIRVKK